MSLSSLAVALRGVAHGALVWALRGWASDDDAEVEQHPGVLTLGQPAPAVVHFGAAFVGQITMGQAHQPAVPLGLAFVGEITMGDPRPQEIRF